MWCKFSTGTFEKTQRWTLSSSKSKIAITDEGVSQNQKSKSPPKPSEK
jgi:hypothetical protein